MTMTQFVLPIVLFFCVSVSASNTDSQTSCVSPEAIEEMNEHKIKKTAHVKGGSAKLLIALDPSFSAPEFDYGDSYRDEHFIEAMKSTRELLFEAGINEVVIWRLPRRTMGSAVGFKDGCAVSGYGEPDYHEKLMLMHKAFKKINEYGLDSDSARESIKQLIMATPFSRLYKDEMVDVVINNLRPLMTGSFDPDFSKELYELSVGLVWHYAVEGSEQEKAIAWIRRSVLDNEIEWFELVEYGQRYWIRNTSLGQVEARNYFNRDFDSSEPIEEALVFKHPASVGETWNESDSPTSYLGRQKVRVPAGTFDCHMYRFDLGYGGFSESCVAEGIGVVFNRFKSSEGSIEVSKLVRFGHRLPEDPSGADE